MASCCSALFFCANVSRRLLPSRVSQLQPHQTLILKRKHVIPLSKREKPIYAKKLKEKHYVYEVVRDDSAEPLPDIDCVLTQHIDSVGVKGGLVSVNRELFRQELLPSGAAVYASPENIEQYCAPAPPGKTKYSLLTYRLLWATNLPIKMSPFKPWTLSKAHIRTAFRHMGVVVESEDSITLPEDPITNEHNEQVPFNVQVKVNDADEATVICYIVPFTTNEARKGEFADGMQLPLHRQKDAVSKELLDLGLYDGTT